MQEKLATVQEDKPSLQGHPNPLAKTHTDSLREGEKQGRPDAGRTLTSSTAGTDHTTSREQTISTENGNSHDVVGNQSTRIHAVPSDRVMSASEFDSMCHAMTDIMSKFDGELPVSNQRGQVGSFSNVPSYNVLLLSNSESGVQPGARIWLTCWTGILLELP